MDCISEGSDEILRSRVEDTVRLCEKRGVPCFLGFLDLREQAAVQQMVMSAHGETVTGFYGGYSEAERTFFSASPSYFVAEAADFPIVTIAFKYRTVKNITHRDVLGTLMSLGIRRDAVGDILCGEGLTVVFVRAEVARFVCDQVDRIGGEGVSVIKDYSGELPISVAYTELRDTIASPRLDSVVKVLTRCSREQASELIARGSVSLNHRLVDSASKAVSVGDVVSIRGCGRYLIDQIGPETKKGRLVLCARRRL